MRSVSERARRGVALLILLAVVTAVPAFADDPPPAPVVLEGRIHVPGGLTDEQEPPSVWELLLVWLQGRIHIPLS